VEGGAHDVVFTYRPHRAVLALTASASALFALWWIVRAATMLHGRKKRREA